MVSPSRTKLSIALSWGPVGVFAGSLVGEYLVRVQTVKLPEIGLIEGAHRAYTQPPVPFEWPQDGFVFG